MKTHDDICRIQSTARGFPPSAALFGALVVGLLSVGWPPGAAAAGAKKDTPKKEQSLREKYALPTHIQMRPIMAPVRHRHQSVSAISMFLEANHRRQVGAICRKVPKIKDAVLRVLSREPILTRRGELVLDGVASRLIGPINRALGDTGVKALHIEPGAIRLGNKGGLSRLPFATINGCKGIKKIEMEIIKRRQKEKGKKK